MKKIIILVSILVFLVSITSSLMIIKDNSSVITLEAGKNYIIFNLSNEVYAAEMMHFNPGIKVISYTEDNITTGYVNAFGGLGKNFIIQNNITYEITTNEKINIFIPYN